MAKKASGPKWTAPDVVQVTYRLSDLPSAQHKAGLAGMVLQIQAMHQDGSAATKIPQIIELTQDGATVEFSAQSIQELFDILYDATKVEVESDKPWPNATPLAEVQREVIDEKGKKKKLRLFVYEDITPTGRYLRDRLSEGQQSWLRLWQKMLWDIPRGKPTTRIPFNERAEQKPVRLGKDAWDALVKNEKARCSGQYVTDSISSALLLGAQSQSAESIAFAGRVDQTLLLHFWPLTVRVFVPRQISADGNTNSEGFTVAVPEVSNLAQFCQDYPKSLAVLGTETVGYRPLESLIDIPDQSALEFLDSLLEIAGSRGSDDMISDSALSIEYFHMVKNGKNVKVAATGRIAPTADLIRKYRQISDRRTRLYRNSLFRACLLKALLNGEAWYQPFHKLMTTWPSAHFVPLDGQTRDRPFFASDARRRFEVLSTVVVSQKGDFMSPPTSVPEDQLAALVFRLVRTYVSQKVEAKTGLSWNDVREANETVEGKTKTVFLDAKERVVSDAFLAMRSRRERDFIDYFTATICSVKQFLKQDDYEVVARALLARPEDVKTLCLLALSANA
jgi:CRISPR-associated protein Cmx8